MDVMQIVSIITALVGLVTSLLFIRRAKKAEVRAKEAEVKAREIENERGNIATAEAMIDLVKKANAEAADIQRKLNENLKKENEKFRKYVLRLEAAFNSIHRCTHRNDCPVYAELQDDEGSDPIHTDGHKNR